MSTLLGGQHHELLKSEADLAGYFERHSKPLANHRVGLEAELIGINPHTGKALPYEGEQGVRSILNALAKNFGYEPVEDHGSIIALTRKDTIIGLEPGGQIELSAPPVADIFIIEKQLKDFLAELREIEKQFSNVKWLAYGIQPFSPLDEISLVPKKRYAVLADYLKTRGPLSHHMMKRTATNQVNLDYANETDAMEKIRTTLGISSIISAMFAHASFSEGELNGFASYRLEIWNHTAPERSGLIPEFMEPHKKFKDYMDYCLNMPMIFIVRGEEWIPMKGKRFRDFILQGHEGYQATLGDFELHLSTAFPEARFKQYLEVRGTDCQRPELIPALAAFWKGILYDAESRKQAWDLVSFASADDRLRLHGAMPREGLKASLAGKPILPLAKELVDIACRGLGRQQVAGRKDECVFLDQIREMILKPGKSPGEMLIEKWNGELQQNPEKLIQYLGI